MIMDVLKNFYRIYIYHSYEKGCKIYDDLLLRTGRTHDIFRGWMQLRGKSSYLFKFDPKLRPPVCNS